MPSEQGWNTARALLARYGDVPDDEDAEAIDAELQEVREVLEGIRGFYGTADCWCDSEGDAPHFGHCQRARALYQRLRVDGAPGEEGKNG